MAHESRFSHFFRERKNKRALRKLKPLIKAIREEETNIRQQRDLVSRTREFQARLARGETVNALIVPAFATAAEAARRILGEEVHDVQIMGGLVLHQGSIAEMKSGEGKTLTAILPAYLNALAGQVHIATQNDYLTTRDFNTMGPIFDILGIPANRVTSTMSIDERANAYRASVVYVTNHELVFDFLHDSMRYPSERKIFPRTQFAIIDEIDSILIDEARTPLIVSELKQSPAKQLSIFAKIVRSLKAETDYIFDKKIQTAFFLPEAFPKIEKMVQDEGLSQMQRADAIFFLDKALKAETLFEKGKDYLVENGKIFLVDEFTGRLMRDRRYMEGVHQAIEAKEGIDVGPTDKILASMTYQSFFLKYLKLGGITGTVFPEVKEFEEIYKIKTVVVPTNKKLNRKDLPTRYFPSEKEKIETLLKEVTQYRVAGQPVVVATTTVEDSERLSRILAKSNIEHQLLNANTEKQEPQIVKNAGAKGVVTVATNMAGRGTDIDLEQASKQAGGMVVIGTKINQSFRIDNQLRGRAGRQGDPGLSQFFVSPEDEVIKIFGGLKSQKKLEEVARKKPGQASRKLDRIVNAAQTDAETRDRAIRRLYLELNEMVEFQRKVLYKRRDEIFEHPHLTTEVDELMQGEIEYIVEVNLKKRKQAGWKPERITAELSVMLEDSQLVSLSDLKKDEMVAALTQASSEYLKKITQNLPSKIESEIIRYVLLSAIDDKWSSHLEMAQLLQDHLPTISLTHPDPLASYRKRLTAHFEMTLIDVRSDAIRNLFYLLRSGEYTKIPILVKTLS